MLLLVNANRMQPPIAPIGLDYVATSARRAGIETEIVDLGLARESDRELEAHFSRRQPKLVGVSFRNVDDSFWPSAQWFLPDLVHLVGRIRTVTDAPLVLGGVGFSVFARRIVRHTGVEFGIRGDGERAIVDLYRVIARGGSPKASDLAKVPGLVYRTGSGLAENAPAWGDLDVPTTRDAIDNRAYFELGGQAGVETKRGCPRPCIYCADPLAKGPRARVRPPSEIADEFEALHAQGISVVHLCDGEFNVPHGHALRVCEELERRGLSRRIGWYTYAAVHPFDDELAKASKRAGCLGIDFTGDAASSEMLTRYAAAHTPSDVARAVALCRRYGITCMIDLLLGGPGETPETARATFDALRRMEPDCVGVGMGLRIYPGTPAERLIGAEGPVDCNPNIVRKYEGPVDLLRPTYYLSAALGQRPAALVKDLIGGDPRFFPPAEDAPNGHAEGDHNYNQNTALTEAIARGRRGAYWDILRQL